jgi:hypothetical protein
MTPRSWRIAFQAYNPGAQRFWSQVASDAAGDQWAMHDNPPGQQETWKVDTWITFQTCLLPRGQPDHLLRATRTAG